jgi:ADP-ribose diphosphatase
MKKILPTSAILIPDNASKVFSGQIFDVYQWPQKMFDGSTKTFELLKRSDTTQIIVVQDGKLFLVNDEQPGRSPRLHFPGGRADEDNSWHEAAVRELLEETGLVCKNLKLIDVVQPVPKIEWFVPWFVATDILSHKAQKLDADGEKIEVIQKSFEDIRELVLKGREPTMQYATGLFLRCKTLDDLLNLPEFQGEEVDR